jgi:hypothetical protein
MHLGIDFDNTIVCCDDLFYKSAVIKKLIPETTPKNKSDVRDYLRRQGREDEWTALQGYVYGSLLKEAPPFPGVVDFFSYCKAQNIPVNIISHKTRAPFLGHPYDLHQAARDWLQENGFFSEGRLRPDQVYFELTKDEKLRRIQASGCTHFIDDLPEFLGDPRFPAQVERIWFAPEASPNAENFFVRMASWNQIKQWIAKSK